MSEQEEPIVEGERQWTPKRNPRPPHQNRNHHRQQYYNANRNAASDVLKQQGFSDLRELLNKKRIAREQATDNPEEATAEPTAVPETKSDPSPTPGSSQERKGGKRQERKPRPPPNSPKSKETQPKSNAPRDIENPMNIKVQFSIATGEHTYELDKDTILPTIKHVPDQKPFRGGRRGGRGYRGYTRNFRNSNRKRSEETDEAAAQVIESETSNITDVTTVTDDSKAVEDLVEGTENLNLETANAETNS